MASSKSVPMYECKNVTQNNAAQNFSRYELLKWVNEVLDLKLKSVESLRTGAAYCQIMNMIFPGSVSIKKVKLEAKLDYEIVSNLKQLQLAFKAIGCDKNVPIDKLIKGRFQENFEFLLWFRNFAEANKNAAPSDFITKCKLPKKNLSSKSILDVVLSTRQEEQAEKLKSEISGLQERVDMIRKEKVFYHKKLINIEQICLGYKEAANVNKTTLIEEIFAELSAPEEDEEEQEAEDRTF